MALLRNGIPYDEGPTDPYSSWDDTSRWQIPPFGNRFIEAAMLGTEPWAYA